MQQVFADRVFHHPIERVFARYTDHVGWGDWAGFGGVYLTREGEKDRDGVGAVRGFKSAPGLREEVMVFEAPNRMEYRIAQGGFPLTDHRGVVVFTPEGDGTRVSWQVTFRTRIPGIGPIVTRGLSKLFHRVLESLARDLDRTR